MARHACTLHIDLNKGFGLFFSVCNAFNFLYVVFCFRQEMLHRRNNVAIATAVETIQPSE